MQQQPRLPLWFLIANWMLIAAAFAVGIMLGGRHIADLPEPQGAALQLVYREILRSHVDPQEGGRLLDRAITGMVRSLDPYSRYVAPSEVRQYEEDNTGHYEGVGLEMAAHEDEIVVYYPFPGGPAERAGIRPGDRLVAVDGLALDTADRRRRVAELVRGHAGTEVRLQCRRDDGTVEFTVRRGDVQKSCVKWAHFVDPGSGLAYVHVADFHPGGGKQLVDAIAALQRSAPLRGLVLDLRFDGGGSLDECIAIANAFLPTGLIVSQQRRSSEVVERYEAKAELCLFPDLPLVVLVNEASASASEVLAGALQDHARAAIVGERTYGKAFVNTVYTWKDYDFRLKLTTGAYLTPNGRKIERHHLPDGATAAADTGGIPPDVVVSVTKEQRLAIDKRLGDHEPPAVYLAAFTAVAARHGVQVPGPPTVAEDPQLAQAVSTLRNRIVGATTTTTEPGKDK